MNIGDIYKAPWGTYAILSLVPLVLRSLDTMNACVMPPDGMIDPAYVATGERAVRPPVSSLPPVSETGKSVETGKSASPQTGRSESVAPPHVTSQVPLSTSAGPPNPLPALVDTRCANPFGFPPVPPMAQLTLGGMRPGTGLCIIPGKPTLWWRPCLTRTEYGGTSHCTFLSLTSDQSFYCWECRRFKPWVVIVSKFQDTSTELEQLPSTSVPELSTSMAPTPESSGVRELVPAVSCSVGIPAQHSAGARDLLPVSVTNPASIPATPASRPSTPLVPGTSPKDDVGGFARPRRPEYRPLTLEAWREELTERSAIIEYLGGYPRATAEQIARTMVPKPLAFTKGAHYVPDGENYW